MPNWVKLSLLVLLIYVSGNPFAIYSDVLLVGGALLSFLFALKEGTDKTLKKQALIIALFFLGFEFIHGFMYGFYFKTIIRLALQFGFGYSVVKLLNINFFPSYVKVLRVLCILSLIFYVLTQSDTIRDLLFQVAVLLPVPEDVFNYSSPTILVYTFDETAFTEFHRNSGFTWEAGAFVSFIIPALYFHLLSTFTTQKKIKIDTTFLIFIITIITTYSTSGYIALFILLVSFNLAHISVRTAVTLVLVLIIGVTSFLTLPFLKAKIENEIFVAMIEGSNNRLGSFIADWFMIKEKPIFGWSRKLENQFGFSGDELTQELFEVYHRPNGVSRLLVGYGSIYFLVFFGLYYYGIFKYLTLLGYEKKEKIVIASCFVLVCLILGFSQILFEKILFKSFIFMGPVLLSQQNENVENINS